MTGIHKIKTRFSNQSLIISPDCEYMVKELESYCWDKNKDKPVKQFDHLIDPLHPDYKRNYLH